MVGCAIIIMFAGGYCKAGPGLIDRSEIYQWDDDNQEWVLTGYSRKGRSYHAVSIVTLDDDLINYCN